LEATAPKTYNHITNPNVDNNLSPTFHFLSFHIQRAQNLIDKREIKIKEKMRENEKRFSDPEQHFRVELLLILWEESLCIESHQLFHSQTIDFLIARLS
jgi:hypothetical protein